MRLRATACAALVSLVLALPASARAQGVSNRVSLRFGWEPGLALRVETKRVRTRSTTASETRSSTSRYTLKVESEGENLRVRFTDPAFDVDAAPGGEAPPEQAKMMDKLAGLMPDFVVTRAGEFVGLHDLPGYQKRLGDFLAEMMPPDMDAAVVAQIQAMMTSEQFLHARVAEEWNAIVGAWVGGSFEIGKPTEYSQNETIGFFPGQKVKMNYAFTAEEVSLCDRGGAPRACATLSMRSVADPADVERLIAELLEKLAPGQIPTTPTFLTLEVENLLRLTTEPSGLVPHAYTLKKSIRGTVDTPNGPQPIEQVDLTEVKYAAP